MVPDVVLTIRDAGRTVYLNAGQCLAVDLEDISTTGFRWTFSTPDDSVLSLEGNEFHGHTGVGGGGVRRLLYKAIHPGRQDLCFELKRPWESNAIKHFEVSIIVSSKSD